MTGRLGLAWKDKVSGAFEKKSGLANCCRCAREVPRAEVMAAAGKSPDHREAGHAGRGGTGTDTPGTRSGAGQDFGEVMPDHTGMRC